MTESNGWTTKEILLRIEKKVDEQLADHEDRIRSGESSISRLKGALAVIALALPIVAGVAASLIH